jgi:hypothetical protein
MHIKLTNGIPEKYTIGQLRRDNPQVSFPKSIPDSTLAEYDVYPLIETDRPQGDVVTEGVPALNENTQQWEQTWVVRDFTPEEAAQNLADSRARMVVTPRQARLALLGSGQLASIETAIAALEEPTKSAVEIEWEYAVSIERTSTWVVAMTDALGMTPEQVDQLFETAATL